MNLKSDSGYNISYNESIPPSPKTIIIAMHGFCGDQKSGCISLLEDSLKNTDVGLIKFDWPGHGDSEVDGEKLTVANCLTDLDSIVHYAKKNWPSAKLVAFATSFGGYLTLLYHYSHRDVFDKLILRSPAIKMYNVLTENLLTPQLEEELEKNHYINYGFERITKITESFVNELKENNPFILFGPTKLTNIFIIHGTADDLVPFSDSETFAQTHNCTIYPVKNADHRYKKPGELEKVISITKNILD